jgi:hypothetical protein
MQKLGPVHDTALRLFSAGGPCTSALGTQSFPLRHEIPAPATLPRCTWPLGQPPPTSWRCRVPRASQRDEEPAPHCISQVLFGGDPHAAGPLPPTVSGLRPSLPGVSGLLARLRRRSSLRANQPIRHSLHISEIIWGMEAGSPARPYQLAFSSSVQLTSRSRSSLMTAQRCS